MSLSEPADPLREALRSWSQERRGDAMAAAGPLAESGGLTACVMMAQFIRAAAGDQDQAADAAFRFARIAADAGLAQPGFWWFNQYANSSNPDHITLAVDIARAIQGGAPTADLVANWESTWKRGYEWAAHQLFIVVADPSLLPGISEVKRRIQDLIAVVEAEQRTAIESMASSEQAIGSERARLEELVGGLANLISRETAGHMASAYAKRATRTGRAAWGWTGLALFLGALAIAWAIVVAVDLFIDAQPTDVPDLVAKSLVSLSVLVVAGYTAGIGANNRRMAWHWRHVALQIETADPYIGNLDQRTRDRLQAALAVRLFPGQSLDPQAGNQAQEKLDLGVVVAAVLGEQVLPRDKALSSSDSTRPSGDGPQSVE